MESKKGLTITILFVSMLQMGGMGTGSVPCFYCSRYAGGSGINCSDTDIISFFCNDFCVLDCK